MAVRERVLRRLRVERLVRSLALIACFWLALPAAAVQSPASLDLPASVPGDWHRLGSGEMRWLGLRIYEASLWAPQPSWRPEAPFALMIRYARAIPSSRLVQTSLDEMRRLGMAEEARMTSWRSALEQAFPDVEAGDVIVGVSIPGEGVFFYHRGQPTGRLADDAFARAFFAIWLDERTREPRLRARLLGSHGNG